MEGKHGKRARLPAGLATAHHVASVDHDLISLMMKQKDGINTGTTRRHSFL